MIKARGGLLCHAHSARGALLQRQPSQRALTVDSSLKILLTSRGFRGFLSLCDRGSHESACRSLRVCSRAGSNHRNILAVWSFESKNSYFDHGSLSVTNGLHTSTSKKLTTSELIKSLQLAKSGVSKSPTSSKALVTGEHSLEGGSVHESTSIPDKLQEDCKRDVAAIKKPLSKLIPQHVVNMGLEKKERFSKQQDQQGGSSADLQSNLPRVRVSNQRRIIALLHLESVRNDVADKYSRSSSEVGANHGIRKKLSDQKLGSQDPGFLSTGKKAVTSGSVKPPDFAAAAFDTVPPFGKMHGSDPMARPVAHHKDDGDVCSEKHSATNEASWKQIQGFHQSTVLTREGSRITSKWNFENPKQADVQFQPCEISEKIATSQHLNLPQRPSKITQARPVATSPHLWFQKEIERNQLDGEHSANREPKSKEMIVKQHGHNGNMQTQKQDHFLGERTKPIGTQASCDSAVTNKQTSLHQRCSNVFGEYNGIAGKPYAKLSNNAWPQKSEGVGFLSQQDTNFGVGRVNSAFDRWASQDSLPEESMPSSARKPFDRNRPRKRKKNELKEKDLSVKPNPGEAHYEYLIRRKQVRAEAQKALVDDVDDYQHVGDDWMRKRLGWLCKEIPVLKASGLVKMLNNQRKWIKQEHLKELIEHLVRYMELNRAHRVLKWMQQQPFYEFEYALHNNMAFILGRNDKLSRCQDVFDEIVRNGVFPDASVFTALIKAYLNKGDQGDIEDAWKLYNQMLQLGLTVNESLSETLLKSLTCPTGRWIRQAEELFVKMKASGMYVNEEMYSQVIDLYGKRGDHNKIDAMLNELRKSHLNLTIGILNAKLEACIKDGNVARAEDTLSEVVELGVKADWRTYAHLIQVYGKAQMPMQSWEMFEKMKGLSISINFVTYHAIIEAMAADGQHEEQVMQVLTELEQSEIKPRQPCYNSVMNMYLRLKKHDEVESIFKRGKAAKVRPAHAAYNMLMKAYTESGQLEKAEALFQEMKVTEGMGPNSHTYNILLEGYGVACFKVRVRELFEEMTAKGCQLDPDVREQIHHLVSVKRIVELEKKKLILTDEQREIIPGLLLGGAKMESPDRNRTYELHLEFNCENEVKRVIKDRLSFLFQAWWKPSQAAVSGQSAASSEGKGGQVQASATKSSVHLETVSHGSLRFYAHQYRPNGEPAIPKLIHRWLKPRTLAYWYMYGGRKCQRTGGIILNASKYSGKQIQHVVKALKARTMDCRRKKKRNGDVIRFEGRSATWLWKLMEPHILKTVKAQLKPEDIPVDLALAEGTKSWDCQDQSSSDVDLISSDDDDWDDLEADKCEEPMQILED